MDQLMHDLEASAIRAGTASHMEPCCNCGAEQSVPDDTRFPGKPVWCVNCWYERHRAFEDNIRTALLQMGPGDHPNILSVHPMRA
jgi:hypothetical protein